ncbi:bifunctional glycosyltransferase/CDP-glycerol:glycerophosphate glycerophosphotransferase [Planotetraspora kaengkrachanensis]|uniref:Glycosyltransferase 2-like domain-containing protein n=1 Tax=Planotetraspora kaengkrachanensis TaxID=575193 RepID=A0A8J3V7W4_9ACTN|nr:bifunctional glycosyltransferase/CDP-glycerol:glycerophosphate glycerophosphotransferase [Planotetraspora kaengkrachanensis]GIG82375.1 hypothetical protein Pka01_55020 [Planotetraspora kaengkrachanensis]
MDHASACRSTPARVPPALSVVVPVLGEEEHLEDCLDSLRGQALARIEIVLAGQAAGAVRDRWSCVVVPEGRDAAAARNAGAERATGTYLAFAGAGSVVPVGAYRALVDSLEATGSDLACGRSAPLTTGRTQDERARLPAGETGGPDVLRTHVTRLPRLIHDRSVEDKVFRRTFWDEHRFRFPGGVPSDFPVAVPAHVLSRSTDVLGDVVRLCRPIAEEPGDPERRLAAMLEVSALLERHDPRLRAHWDGEVEEAVAEVLDSAAVRRDLGGLWALAPALATLHPTAADGSTALRRLMFFLLLRGMAKELSEVQRFAAEQVMDRGVVRRGLLRPRWFHDYPFLYDDRIPDEVFSAEHDLELRARVDDVRSGGDGVVRIEGHAYIAHLGSRRGRLELWLRRGDERIELPVTRIPRPDVTADSRQSAVSHDMSGFATEVVAHDLPSGRWTLHVRVSARGVTRSGRAAGARSAGERTFRDGGVRVTLTREDGLVLRAAGRPAPEPYPGDQVTAAEWTGGHELVLSGTGDGDGDRITAACGAERHEWPLRRDGDRWSAVIGRTAGGLPLHSGTWRVSAGGRRLRLSPGLVAELPGPYTTPIHEISFRTNLAGELSLAVRPALGPDERGRRATLRRRGRGLFHGGFAGGLLRGGGRLGDAALFDSYGGGQYSCNPRAISEELARRRPGTELIWVTRDGQFAPPPGVRTVLYGSREHEHALRTSRFVVANRRTQPSWYRKRPDQLFVQTWHGTPLKRLGRDIGAMPYAQRDLDGDLERYAAMWDVLISPNPFSTPILRSAFGFPGEVLNSGYPRNDVLFRQDHGSRVRRLLGVPEDKTIVLYAPTWRDGEPGAPGDLRLRLDAGRAVDALGDDHVLLVRAHYLVADRMSVPPGAIDVSRFPDMADLLAAADVLVSDYSSALFDFACTGRPMVFFAYDLERYRDEMRGFYFDFEADAPGPIVRTSDEVIAALKYGDPSSYKVRYDDFRFAFCPWDDGRASERVVSRMLT